MAGNMRFTVKKSFPNAILVIDRFRIQKLALDALQEIRTKDRWEAIDSENDAIENVSGKVLKHTPELILLLLLLLHRDTLKQLLARSRYLLYKSSYKWTDNQSKKAKPYGWLRFYNIKKSLITVSIISSYYFRFR